MIPPVAWITIMLYCNIMRRRIKQEIIHGDELNTEQYTWYSADTELYMW